jgi:hypothetical protein
MARWFPYFGSGMRRKGNTEIIKTTNYKNNDIAQMKCNSIDLANELQELVIVGSDEPLSRFRSYAQTFFNGDKIEISYINVTFEEFLKLLELKKPGSIREHDKHINLIKLLTAIFAMLLTITKFIITIFNLVSMFT